MSFRNIAAAACATALGLGAAPSSAAVIASLTFDQPAGVVGPSDAIDVFFTLTLDAASDALITDASETILSGFSEAEIIALGGDPTAAGARTYLNVFFQCGDTFTNCFSGAPYTFDFNSGSDGFVGAKNLSLNAGESRSVRFGTFTPTGLAPSGTYDFFNAGVSVNFLTDDLTQPISRTIAETCPTLDARCGFSRTVVGGAVPEPSAWSLMIVGFGTAGALLRRRRLATAVAGA